MYHYVESRGKRKYHYLVENIRVGRDKWKKVKLYLGKGDLKSAEIKRLAEKNKGKLGSHVHQEKLKKDPLYSLLTEVQIKKAEEIKKKYRAFISGQDKQIFRNYYESFVTEFTYDTSAIEGSTVSLEETSMILFDRIAPAGKNVREIREIENHKDAFDYMINYAGDINKGFVLKLHKLLMHNILWKHSGVFRDVRVFVRGAGFIPPEPGIVEREFKNLMNWYRSNKRKYHPIIIAAHFHFVFESIHPFRDGNGRVGRLLLNFILRKNGYPMINIKTAEKSKYYHALSVGNKGDLKPLAGLIYEYLLGSKAWI